MKKIKFEGMKALTSPEAQMIKGGGPVNHSTDSAGDTYFSNTNAYQHDGPTAQYDPSKR